MSTRKPLLSKVYRVDSQSRGSKDSAVTTEFSGLCYDLFMPGPPNKYPWPLWLDGNLHEIKRGIDFECTPNSMRQRLYQQAKATNNKVTVHIDGDTVAFQVNSTTPFKRGSGLKGAPERYPWDLWTNGEWHKVVMGEDFDCTISAFRASLARQAKARGLILPKGRRVVHTSAGSYLHFRFLKPGTPEAARKTAAASRSYPWEIWLDAQTHSIKRWVDFECPTSHMVLNLRAEAKYQNRIVEIQRLDGTTIEFKFSPSQETIKAHLARALERLGYNASEPSEVESAYAY